MPDIIDTLKLRGLPDVLITNDGTRVSNTEQFELRRAEIKNILAEEEYGYIPKKPEHLTVKVTYEDANFCAGKACLKRLNFICENDGKKFSFPAVSVIPNFAEKLPAFIHINFSAEVPDKYLPAEEIIDRGYAIFSFCHNDISADSDDFKSGIGKHLKENRRKKSSPGKIAMWAWAAMRVMDYVETLDTIDCNNVAVIGHTQLGKASLVAGGYDERFKYIISNCSGCAGASVTRGRRGETPEKLVLESPWLFCPRYIDNASAFETRKYDQNFLLALSVPRHILIGNALDDIFSDPESEFLCLASVNEAYRLYGMRGVVHSDEIPNGKTTLNRGDACYHTRPRLNYLSRDDWNIYMDFIDSKLQK